MCKQQKAKISSFFVALFTLVFLFACQWPFASENARATNINLRFLIQGAPNAAKSSDGAASSRLLLPTATKLTVSISPLGEGLSNPDPQTVDIHPGEYSKAVNFGELIVGKYSVKAEAMNAAGDVIFTQTAEAVFAPAMHPLTLNLLPVESSSVTFVPLTAAGLYSNTLLTGESRTYAIPSSALVDGRYHCGLDVSSADVLFFVQNSKGALLNAGSASRALSETVSDGSTSYITLYNSGTGTYSYTLYFNQTATFYVISNSNMYVLPFTLGANGLTAGSLVMPSGGIYGIVVNSAGKNLYAGRSGIMYSYDINPATGDLISGTSLTNANLAGDTSQMAISPNGRFIYFPNSGGSGETLTQVTVSGTAMTSSLFTTGYYWITRPFINPNGSILYIQSWEGNSIGSYAINSVAGTLTHNGNLSQPRIYTSPMVASPNGQYVYAANSDTQISGAGVQNLPGICYYRVNADGSLGVFLTTDDRVDLGALKPIDLAIDPSGSYLYVATDGGEIWVYPIQADGRPTSIPVQKVGATGISYLKYAPGGYVLGSCPTQNWLMVWKIGSDGHLTYMWSATVTSPGAIAVRATP